MFALTWMDTARAMVDALAANAARLFRHYKAVQKALRFLANNPRHPSLCTHEWGGEASRVRTVCGV